MVVICRIYQCWHRGGRTEVLAQTVKQVRFEKGTKKAM